jgi:Family of unknown function (DUF5908)
MPIIIRELHIKVAVNAPNEQSGRGATANAAPNAAQGGDDDDKEAIVAECVEQVMEILRNRLEP